MITVYDPNQGPWGQNPAGQGGNPYDPNDPYGSGGYGMQGGDGYVPGAQGFPGARQSYQGYQGYQEYPGHPGYPQQPGFPGGPGYGEAAYGGGYQQAPGGMAPNDQQFRIRGIDFGQVFERSWRGFTGSAGGWIVLGLAVLAAAAVCGALLLAFLFSTASTTSGVEAVADELQSWKIDLFSLIFVIAIVGPLYNMAVQAAMRISSGENLDVGGFFTFRNFGNFMLVFAAYEVLVYALDLIPFIGGVLSFVVQVVLFFVICAAVDGLDLPTSFARSWQIFSQNIGLCLLCGLVYTLLLIAGALVIGLGLFVAMPMYFVAGAVVYIAATRGVAPAPTMPYEPPFPQGPYGAQGW